MCVSLAAQDIPEYRHTGCDFHAYGEGGIRLYMNVRNVLPHSRYI